MSVTTEFPGGRVALETSSLSEATPVKDKCRSPFEIDNLVSRAVASSHADMLKAFQMYDSNNQGVVTQGEFRRIVEHYCCSLSTDEFQKLLSKLDLYKNGSVPYQYFLERFHSSASKPISPMRRSFTCVDFHSNGTGSQHSRLNTGASGTLRASFNGNDENFLSNLRSRLREKHATVVKACRLFDYNRDHRIKKDELRKVLENYCLSMNNEQYERLWRQFDLQNNGFIDYEKFLSDMVATIPRTGGIMNGSKLLPANTQDVSRSVNMDTLEVKFREAMRQNFAPLVKVFQAFDSTSSGFVTIEQLKSILNQFTIPMTEQIFQELMTRCAVKASSKVYWVRFLQKFQDPQSRSNGQTIPIQSNHRYNGIEGADKIADLNTLLDLLYQDIVQSYSTLRNAFLTVDKTHKGYISNKEWRTLISKYLLRIPKSLFSQLMEVLDPNKTGKITYHKFLQIFEEKESVEAHKWLVSNHRVNDHRHPTLRDQKAFEELLREKISAHWNQLCHLIRRHDPRGEGLLSRKKLLNILSEVSFTVTEDQLKSLTDQLPSKTTVNGRVNYLILLKLLKVDARPSDATGLSTQITKGSEDARLERLTDHERRMHGIDESAQNRTTLMSIEELVIRLQDRLKQHSVELKEAFRQYDRDRRGLINCKDLRLVLSSHGFIMDDTQFQSLTNVLGMDSRHPMDYGLFVDRMMETDFSRPSQLVQQTFLPASNHKVNPIRGDEWSMSAEAAEAKLRQKLRENFTTLREAFHKFDETNQGLLSKRAFRRLLDVFMCSVNNEEFDKLCAKLGLTDTGMVSYPQFLDKFEVRDSIVDGHKWLVSQHRFNQIGDPKSQMAEDIIKALPQKVHQNHNDVARAFCRTDYQGRGCITRREFKELLLRMHFIFNESEFRKLWKYYDVSNRGSLSHDVFINRLKLSEEFTSGDQGGTSSTIIQNSNGTVMRLLQDQEDRHNLIKENNALLSQELTLNQIQDLIKFHIRNDFTDVYTAFRHYDDSKMGHLGMKDFRSMAKACNLTLSEEKFMEVMRSYGINSKTDKVTYQRLSDIFDDTCSGPNETKPVSNGLVNFDGLTGIKLENVLRKQLSSEIDILIKTFGAFDANSSGCISEQSLRNVLATFCGTLSDEQFKYILAKSQSAQNGLVNYALILNFIRGSSDLSSSLLGSKPLVGMYNGDLPAKQLSLFVENYVRNQLEEVKKTLKFLDPLNGGLIAAKDFRDWIVKYVCPCDEQQFNEYWETLPKYDDKLQWRKFLQLMGGEEISNGVNLLNITDTPKAISQQEEAIQANNRQILNALEENGNSAVSSQNFREAILKHWQSIFSKCKSMADGESRVGVTEFVVLLREYNVNMLPGEIIPMLRRFGLRNDKTFEYAPFLRSVVTTSTLLPKHENLDAIRSKLRTAGLPTQSLGDIPQDFVPSFNRIRQQLLVEWRTMRGEFRTMDPNNNGCVTVGQFRRVLNRFITSIEEDALYALISHFDSQRRGLIDYNAFLKTFLHSE